MLKKIVIGVAFSLSFALAAVNYPYPQKKSYGNSTINVGATDASDKLKAKFNSWRSNFYLEGTCGTDACARIRFDNVNQTVSEGIAYAMLMMVYFSDATTSYQSHFDKLWKYYQAKSNARGLMSWKIEGFGAVSNDEGSSNTASDAEFDVAVALVMAHYQFETGTEKKYLTAAQNIISKIRAYEISASNDLHKPGDTWDDERNPSYVSPAAFEIFKEVETSSNAKETWGRVITANYTLLKANQSKKSGIFSDWCDDSGNPSSKGSDYKYDAARTPWRVAWANAWYGHSDAKTLLNGVVSYLGNTAASNIAFDKNSVFVGPFMNAFSVAAANQSKMDAYWTTLIGYSDESSYFKGALQILTGLLATGNMPNLKKLKGDDCCTSGGTTIGTQIDKLEYAASETDDERNYARTWEPWYVFTDASSDNGADGRGGSTVSNETFDNIVYDKVTKQCNQIKDVKVIMKDGSDWVVKIDRYKLDSICTGSKCSSSGYYKWNPYASIGLDAVNNGKTGAGSYNLSNCTGFKYQYKGAAHNFKVQMSTVTNYNYHFLKQTASDVWKTVTLELGDLNQEAWGPTDPVVAFDISKAEAFVWEVKSTISTRTGSLAIKDFHCTGGQLPFPNERPAAQCSGGNSSSSTTASSSSNKSSSSVGTQNSSSSANNNSSSSVRSSSSGGTSSSSSGGGMSSSSSGGGTPIVLPQLVFSNSLKAMQNSINLQVTKDASLKVFDLKGDMVRTFKFTQGNYIVQLSDLPRGLYIVKASNASWKQTITLPVK